MSGYSDTWGPDPREQQWEGQGLMQPWVDPIDWVAGPLGAARKVGLMGAARMLPGAIASNFIPDLVAGRAAEALKEYPVLRTVLPLVLSMGGGMMTDAAIRKASPMINKAYQGSRLMGSERGIFGGVNAQNADLAAMRQAMRMQEAGIDPREIWQKTGWMQGDDGLMRFEIPDNAAMPKTSTMTDSPDMAGVKTSRGEMGDIYKHQKLYNEYPGLKGLEGSMYMGDTLTPSGTYQTGRASINGSPATISPEMNVKGKNFDDLRSVGAHELQHAIQDQEGFAKGGSPSTVVGMDNHAINIAKSKITSSKEWAQLRIKREEMIDKAMAAFKKRAHDPLTEDLELQEMYSNAEHRANAWFNDQPLVKEYNKLEYNSPFEAYRRLHGEAEARLAQKRMNYTPEQRRAIYPYDDLDVPRDELIVRDSNGLMASMGRVSSEVPVLYGGTGQGVYDLQPLPEGFRRPAPIRTIKAQSGQLVDIMPTPISEVVPLPPTTSAYKYPASTPKKTPSLISKDVTREIPERYR